MAESVKRRLEKELACLNKGERKTIPGNTLLTQYLDDHLEAHVRLEALLNYAQYHFLQTSSKYYLSHLKHANQVLQKAYDFARDNHLLDGELKDWLENDLAISFAKLLPYEGKEKAERWLAANNISFRRTNSPFDRLYERIHHLTKDLHDRRLLILRIVQQATGLNDNNWNSQIRYYHQKPWFRAISANSRKIAHLLRLTEHFPFDPLIIDALAREYQDAGNVAIARRFWEINEYDLPHEHEQETLPANLYQTLQNYSWKAKSQLIATRPVARDESLDLSRLFELWLLCPEDAFTDAERSRRRTTARERIFNSPNLVLAMRVLDRAAEADTNENLLNYAKNLITGEYITPDNIAVSELPLFSYAEIILRALVIKNNTTPIGINNEIQAHYLLALLYLMGSKGVSQDIEKSLWHVEECLLLTSNTVGALDLETRNCLNAVEKFFRYCHGNEFTVLYHAAPGSQESVTVANNLLEPLQSPRALLALLAPQVSRAKQEVAATSALFRNEEELLGAGVAAAAASNTDLIRNARHERSSKSSFLPCEKLGLSTPPMETYLTEKLSELMEIAKQKEPRQKHRYLAKKLPELLQKAIAGQQGLLAYLKESNCFDNDKLLDIQQEELSRLVTELARALGDIAPENYQERSELLQAFVLQLILLSRQQHLAQHRELKRLQKDYEYRLHLDRHADLYDAHQQATEPTAGFEDESDRDHADSSDEEAQRRPLLAAQIQAPLYGPQDIDVAAALQIDLQALVDDTNFNPTTADETTSRRCEAVLATVAKDKIPSKRTALQTEFYKKNTATPDPASKYHFAFCDPFTDINGMVYAGHAIPESNATVDGVPKRKMLGICSHYNPRKILAGAAVAAVGVGIGIYYWTVDSKFNSSTNKALAGSINDHLGIPTITSGIVALGDSIVQIVTKTAIAVATGAGILSLGAGAVATTKPSDFVAVPEEEDEISETTGYPATVIVAGKTFKVQAPPKPENSYSNVLNRFNNATSGIQAQPEPPPIDSDCSDAEERVATSATLSDSSSSSASSSTSSTIDVPRPTLPRAATLRFAFLPPAQPVANIDVNPLLAVATDLGVAFGGMAAETLPNRTRLG